MTIPAAARVVLESEAPAHLVTLNPDGTPQISCVWIGLDGDEIVSAHLSSAQKKLRNVRRDPRVALSVEGTELQPPGLKQYVVVHGRARITEGGAPELLKKLANTMLGSDEHFPPPNSPPGLLTRIRIDKVGGMGPWSD